MSSEYALSNSAPFRLCRCFIVRSSLLFGVLGSCRPLLCAKAMSLLFAAEWSFTMRSPKDLTFGSCACWVARFPVWTSARPPCAAFVRKSRSALLRDPEELVVSAARADPLRAAPNSAAVTATLHTLDLLMFVAPQGGIWGEAVST